MIFSVCLHIEYINCRMLHFHDTSSEITFGIWCLVLGALCETGTKIISEWDKTALNKLHNTLVSSSEDTLKNFKLNVLRN